MDLIFEIYKDDGGLKADARGVSIHAQGQDLGQLLSNIQEQLGLHYERKNAGPPPERVSVVWRDGGPGETN